MMYILYDIMLAYAYFTNLSIVYGYNTIKLHSNCQMSDIANH